MDWQHTPHGIIRDAQEHFWGALGISASEVANRMCADQRFAETIALFAKEYMAPQKRRCQNPEWLVARHIMGKHFLGIEEAINHFSINPSAEDLECLKHIPFKRETLEAHRNNHVLVAVMPFSIMDLRAFCCGQYSWLIWKGQDRSISHDWYTDEPFASAKGEAVWQLICVANRTPPDEKRKEEYNWAEFQTLIKAGEYIPEARSLVYIALLRYLDSRESLYGAGGTVSATAVGQNEHVSLKLDMRYPPGGIGLFRRNDEYKSLYNRIHGLGCATALKPDLY